MKTFSEDPEVELTPAMVVEAVSTLFAVLVEELDEKGLVSRAALGERLIDVAASVEPDGQNGAVIGILHGLGTAFRGTPI